LPYFYHSSQTPCLRNSRGSCDISAAKRIQRLLYNHGCCDIRCSTGLFSERQAEATYESLRKLVKPTATVVRDGHRKEVDVTGLVPGDVVILTAGDRIPTDGIVLESVRMAASEAILTGESESIRKDTTPGQNALYMGTTVLSGRGIMQVSHIGKDTELGKIATSLSETEDEATPLQIRLADFSRTLTRIVIVITAVLFFIGLAEAGLFWKWLV